APVVPAVTVPERPPHQLGLVAFLVGNDGAGDEAGNRASAGPVEEGAPLALDLARVDYNRGVEDLPQELAGGDWGSLQHSPRVHDLTVERGQRLGAVVRLRRLHEPVEVFQPGA